MIRRPVLRYYGGKYRLREWVASHFPPHQLYVEPFGGAASVLMYKSRSNGEIYNDLDRQVVNIFRVLRDPEQAQRLYHLLQLTPYAREELELARDHVDDPVEQARRTIVRSFMGQGSDSTTRNCATGFRKKRGGQGGFFRHKTG